MLIKGIVDEDFINYKIPSMYICTNTCSFKCDKESGTSCCQNSSLASQPSIEMTAKQMANRYLKNPITGAVVFGGLEPFDQFEDVFKFILTLREHYHCSDTVVIYTGYNESEILFQINRLKSFKNIIIKYGRFIPNDESRFDDVLGVTLASKNQYAEQIS